MNEDRVNELRRLLRANRRPETSPLDDRVREAMARQEAAMRAHREPYDDQAAGGPGLVAYAPLALGLGAFAAIVLTDGTQDLSWVRFLIAALALWGVAWGGGLLIRSWYGN